jgi:hypothetical protein
MKSAFFISANAKKTLDEGKDQKKCRACPNKILAPWPETVEWNVRIFAERKKRTSS